ncbi:MAG: DNA translocase FtsK 4TM domain-containing protein [Xanthomonadales bacterium]|nr:DNA translocase FtsK 4TM domain-containing protein [Xanthomonadales bacterium]
MVTRLREAAFLVLGPLAIYLTVALVTYDPADPGWSHSGQGGGVSNTGGIAGAWIADIGLTLFGYLAFLFPVFLAFWAWQVLRGEKARKERSEVAVRAAGVLITVLAGCGLAQLHFSGGLLTPEGGGGISGQLVGYNLVPIIGFLGATLLLLASFLAGITLMTGLSWLWLMDIVGAATLKTWTWLQSRREAFAEWRAGRRARKSRVQIRRVESEKRKTRKPPKLESKAARPEESKRSARDVQMPLFKDIPAGPLPPLSMLDEPPEQREGYSAETLQALARQVELKLADFKIEVEVVGVYPGPVITRFELQPAPGVKGAQIANLAKDLARGLSVVSVRVVDVIPGKSVIGLEIPNARREIVYLSEILRSKDYDDANSPLTLGLGKDISGRPVVTNLARMPHLLVAGTTGSGKSVAINAMVLSMLYKASPDQVRLIMIDPKMLELSVYEGIPHLLAPVVTDMKEAANALRWCVAEMERRYKLMAAVGVRNLAGFNRKIREAEKAGKPLTDPLHDPEVNGDEPEVLAPLPNIVVIIDELADMMMIVGKKVEELIARLAQKARASGIYLILATQRPSVDVITGLIKANIPSRIAFQVSSRVDSRTILDQQGAEQLLGHGDMLFLPPGKALPERIHGAFVDDHEVHAVVKYLKEHGEPDYVEEVLEETQTTTDGQVINDAGIPQTPADEQSDELFDKAVYVVTKSRRASISYVQRNLRIGYNRAARLIEDMEAQGIVSPPEHNGNREVLAPPPPED